MCPSWNCPISFYWLFSLIKDRVGLSGLQAINGKEPFISILSIYFLGFRNVWHMNRHTRERHSENPEYFCTECDKQFFTMNQLHNHKKTHGTCHICNQYFVQLSNHMTKEHSEKTIYQCEKCAKTFLLEKYYDKHVVKCDGTRRKKNKEYKCEVCEKVLTSRIDYEGHTRIHTGELPFSCEICLKAFRSERGLERHIESRHSEKEKETFTCNICNKQIADERYLKKHMETQHLLKPYSCDRCDKSFPDEESLEIHKKEVQDKLIYKQFNKKN